MKIKSYAILATLILTTHLALAADCKHPLQLDGGMAHPGQTLLISLNKLKPLQSYKVTCDVLNPTPTLIDMQFAITGPMQFKSAILNNHALNTNLGILKPRFVNKYVVHSLITTSASASLIFTNLDKMVSITVQNCQAK